MYHNKHNSSNGQVKDLSLVIPVYNEVENLRPLAAEIRDSLANQAIDYEVVFVDDGSSDGSFALLRELAAEDPRVVVIGFRRNFGQTAAFSAGFDFAVGKVIVTLDADLQNPPADIPSLVAKLDEGYDVVNGWRQDRQDNWLRRIPSTIANWLIKRSTGVQLRDRGCSLRAFRADVIDEINLYGEMHRFIPELVDTAGFSMTEVPVSHRPRIAGQAKYGLSRTFRVILDLLTILFLRKYGDRPMHLFGALGILSGGAGLIIGLYLTFLKLWAGVALGNRPMLLLAVLLIILGTQFLAMGLLAELLVRTYYESQGKPVYHVREVLSRATEPSV